MTNVRKSAFVTDGIWRKSLAVARALSTAGVEVGVGERTWMSPSFLSRHVKHKYVYPSREKDSSRFLDRIRSIIRSNKYDVLITPEEETSLLVAQNVSELSQYIRIPLASYEKILFARNKYNILMHAQKIGIHCPKTLIVKTLDDAQGSVGSMQFPMVLKPVIGTGGHGIRYVYNRNEFDLACIEMFKRYENFLIQEYIPGSNYYGVSVIFNANNQMRSAFTHKKIRQYPITGGASTFALSVLMPDLVEISRKLLSSIGWYGVANIEFKIDKRDGLPKLMEVNPRLWGSLQLAIASGLNIPYMMYQLAMNGDIDPNYEYKTGVKFRWFMHGDLMNFISNLTVNRQADIDVFKLFERNCCHATWRLSDPLPYLGLSLALADYLTSDELKKYRT